MSRPRNLFSIRNGLELVSLFTILSFNLYSKKSSADDHVERFVSVKDQVHTFYLNPFVNLPTQRGWIEEWAWKRESTHEKNVSKLEKSDYLKIPPQAGRAALAKNRGPFGGYVLLKGTGVNPEHTGSKNVTRYTVQGYELPIDAFNGKFTTRESIFDIWNSHYLKQIGVKTPIALGFVELQTSPHQPAESIFAREFIVQTRLGDLTSVPPDQAKRLIQNAIDELFLRKLINHRMSLEEYYFWLMHEIAKSMGRIQAAGYAHGTLHMQQITLAGEIADLGTGTWVHDSTFNHWFKNWKNAHFTFDRQPIAALNTLLRSHAVAAEGAPRLLSDSKTLATQKDSLIGVIASFDSITAERIKNRDPEKYFWEVFDHYYQLFDHSTFTKSFNPGIEFVSLKDGQWIEKVGLPASNNTGILEHRLKFAQALDQRIVSNELPIEYILSQLSSLPRDQQIRMNLNTQHIKSLRRTLLKTRYFAGTKAGYFSRRLANYLIDPIAQEKMLARFQTQNILSSPKVSSTPKHERFGVQIDPHHKSIEKYKMAFKRKLKVILDRYGSLRKPEAVQEVMYTISLNSMVDFVTDESPTAIKKAYDKINSKRTLHMGSLCEIFRFKVGMCHDASLLAYMQSLWLHEEDPYFTGEIRSSVNFNSENSIRKHFFVEVRAGERAVYIIDPVTNYRSIVGTPERLRNPLFPESKPEGIAWYGLTCESLLMNGGTP